MKLQLILLNIVAIILIILSIMLLIYYKEIFNYSFEFIGKLLL